MITNEAKCGARRHPQSNKIRSSALTPSSVLAEHVDFAAEFMLSHRLQRKETEGAPECSVSPNSELAFLERKYQLLKSSLSNQKARGETIQARHLQEMGNLMNIIGMKYSQNNDSINAESWLKRALKYGEYEGTGHVKIITFNNLACVYKRAGDLGLAVMYITKAQKEADNIVLAFETEMGAIDQNSRNKNKDIDILKVVTDCSLNLCAILSAMGEHYKALGAARKALGLLCQQRVPKSYYLSLFPIIKYNEAVELERLRKYPQAEAAYLEASISPGITEQLSERLNKALQQIRIVQDKAKQKQRVTLRARKSNRTRLSLPKFCLQQNAEENQQFYSTISTAQKEVLLKRKSNFEIKFCKQNAELKFQSTHTNDSQVKYRSAESQAVIASSTAIGRKYKKMTIQNFYCVHDKEKASQKSTAVTSALSTFRNVDRKRKSVLGNLNNNE